MSGPGPAGSGSILGRRWIQMLLALVAVLWLVPATGLAITSLRPGSTYGRSGWWTVLWNPDQLTLANYTGFLDDGNLLGSIWNTILISVPSTILPVALAAMAGYALAWIPFRGRTTVYLIVVGLLVVPLQLALLPALELFRFVGLGGIASVWVFHTAFGLPLGIFLMRSFFAGIPQTLIDAARLDGARDGKIFRSIALPLARPALISLALFQFAWTWNDLLVALVFAGNRGPVTVAIQQRLDSLGSNIEVVAPGLVLAAFVPVTLFFVFQSRFEGAADRSAVR